MKTASHDQPDLSRPEISFSGSNFRLATTARSTLGFAATRLWSGNLAFVYLFLVYGFSATAYLALLTPPYQVADEGAQFFRADQVSMGGLIGERSGPELSGGVIDQAISRSYALFYPIVLHPERKITSALSNQAASIKWDHSQSFRDFANTSIYPPVFYALSAAVIRFGKYTDLSVVHTLKLARLVNGAVAVLLGGVALVLAGTAAPWFFALLTLPMTLFQMASASQDSLMVATAAVAAALFIRLARGDRAGRSAFGLLCVLLGLIAMARIPYVTLALLPLALRRPKLGARLCGSAVVAACGLGWAWIASRFALVPSGLPGANASAQIHHLLDHPSAIGPLIVNTFRYQGQLYIESFIGRLGWQDCRLPELYIHLAVVTLLIAVLASVVSVTDWRHTLVQKMIVLLAIVSSIIALFAALYVSWSPVGDFIVGGIQGRYFIPLAFIAAALFSVGRKPLLGRMAIAGKIIIAAFPMITLPVVLLSIVARYYVS